MTRFQTEPALPHDRQPQTAVLLINLGTPSAPTAEAVRPFLRDFLSDQRVVELKPALWQPILRGAILPFRAKSSAANYKKIWLKEGSPLYIYSRRQADALAQRLLGVLVRPAMTYGLPGVADTMAELKAQGVTRILAVPLYPQYASSSSGAALDQVFRAMLRQRNQVGLRTVRSFYNHPAYIEALRQQVSAYWQQHGRGGHLMMSFTASRRRITMRATPIPTNATKPPACSPPHSAWASKNTPSPSKAASDADAGWNRARKTFSSACREAVPTGWTSSVPPSSATVWKPWRKSPLPDVKLFMPQAGANSATFPV
ncbi:ferrochelatase [Neisseria elongata subsp. glycolytica ATCC 29315]|uniref:Ferrochelatase n=1 Tax=Neisseria elongata subsp. glycolytica ATCC 29315 TaxID=546263 RepID=D4DQS8_NEIEG|nr:ferrochelatase [Neisseria elongata subsp. glycolytica ATCC 29315]